MAIDWDRAIDIASGELQQTVTVMDEDTVNVSAGKVILYVHGDGGGGGGGGGEAVWGSITGTLSNQVDLQTALSAKANTADLGDLATQDTVDYATEVTNKPTLGSLAAKNTADYVTDITNKPTLGTMASVNDAPSDSKTYGRKNGVWTEVTGGGGGGSATWGDITGTLSDQTDLQTALDGKVDDTGDTMTGDLTIKSSDISWYGTPSEPVVGNGINLTTLQGSPLGGLYLYQDTDGSLSTLARAGIITQGGASGRSFVLIKGTPSVGYSSDFAFALQISGYFDATETYAVGDYCVYGQTLYRFTSAHTGAWLSSDVSEVNIADELKRIEAGGGGSTDWDDITNKPSTFPPEAHNHDNRYYKQSEVNAMIAAKTDLSVIAPIFSASTAYSAGDFVTYSGKLYAFSSAHSAGAWTGNDAYEVKVGGALQDIYALIHAKALHISMASTSSLGTISNAAITTTMRVVSIVWGTPANVTSDVTWNTNTAGQLVLSGTLSGATTAEIDLIDFG